LMDMLRERIDDRPFLGLIRKWLKAGVLSTKTKILLYVKILPSLPDLQPNLFTTLLAKKDMLTNAIYSRFKPRNSQLAS